LIYGFILYVFVLVWDFKIDWNLFNLNSKNVLLRNKLSFSKWVYYVCIIANTALRLLWVFSIVKMTFDKESWVLISSFLEILREIMWVILKVDNESYHNIEGHRDYLHVPSLPKERIIEKENKKEK